MDITNFMTQFINMFLDLFKFVYNTLDSIKFYNISLLQYTISVFVLYPILTMLFTLVTSRNLSDNVEKKSKSIENEDKSD